MFRVAYIKDGDVVGYKQTHIKRADESHVIGADGLPATCDWIGTKADAERMAASPLKDFQVYFGITERRVVEVVV